MTIWALAIAANLVTEDWARADPPHDGATTPMPEWTPHAVHRGVVNRAGQRAGTYVPLRDPADRPSVTVYGYWPYWSDPLSTVEWDQLTHVAIFDVGTDAAGNLTNLTHWTNNAANAVALAAPYGVHVDLCLTSFDDVVMSSVLSNATNRAALVAHLRDQVNAYGANGVNIDFEGLDVGLKSNFVTFLQDLRAEVDEVFVAMPAVDWAGSYDYDQIAFATDGLFVMGYDYYWSGGSPGPTSPLYSSSRWGTYSLDWTLTDYRTWGAPDASILMGLPLYGQDWPTTNNVVPGTATANASSVLFADAVVDYGATGRLYDTQADAPYTFPSGTHQEWADDADSIATKADWALSEGIAGIGFWALGYDDTDLELWANLDALTHADGMQLTISPGVAGQVNTFTVTGATPNRNVKIYRASATLGTSLVNGCANALQLDNALQLSSGQADATGTYVFARMVPASQAGLTRRFQAITPSDCRVTTAVVETL